MGEPPIDPADPAPFFQRRSRSHLLAAAALTALGFALLSSDAASPEAPLWQATTLSGSSLAMFAVAGALLTGPSLRAALGIGGNRLRIWEIAVLGLGLIAASHLAESALREAPSFEHSTLPRLAERIAAEGRAGTHPLSALLFGSAVFAAIGEELFFRGWMLRVLIPAYGWVFALTASSIAFGVIHGDPLHALGAGVLGLYIGGVALRSGSVGAPIVCHFANNAIAVLGQSGWLAEHTNWIPDPLWTAMCLLVAISGVLLLVYRKDAPPAPRWAGA